MKFEAVMGICSRKISHLISPIVVLKVATGFGCGAKGARGSMSASMGAVRSTRMRSMPFFSAEADRDGATEPKASVTVKLGTWSLDDKSVFSVFGVGLDTSHHLSEIFVRALTLAHMGAR